jgi:hypothetical protein
MRSRSPLCCQPKRRQSRGGAAFGSRDRRYASRAWAWAAEAA